MDEVEPIGLEPTTSCMPCKRDTPEIKPDDAKNGGDGGSVTDSARPECADRPVSAELARVMDAWPDLSEAVRVGIVAMVESVSGDREGA